MFRSLPVLFLFVFAVCGGEATQKKSAQDSAESLRLFGTIDEEQLKPTIWYTGDTTITNEDRLDLFEKHVKNIGGAYIGVGSTQNLTLAAWARSEWIWLMDFTQIVVRANKIQVALIKRAATPAEFRELWHTDGRAKAEAMINEEYAQDPELKEILKTWKLCQPYQDKRFRTDDKLADKYGFRGWLYDQGHYDHIRGLARAGKIKPIKGDLRGPSTVLSVAARAKEMNVPLRIVYYSNAEEYFVYGDQFRKNWTSIPVDEKSLIVRTISVNKQRFPWSPGSSHSTDRGFHYNVMSAALYQDWLRRGHKDLRSRDILRDGQTDRENGFTLVTHGPGPADLAPEFKAQATPGTGSSAGTSAPGSAAAPTAQQ